MAAAQASDGQNTPFDGTVADKGVGRIVRTGRKKAALSPDPRRKRQLVGAVPEADAAFVESHASEGLRVTAAAVRTAVRRRLSRAGAASSSGQCAPASFRRRLERQQGRGMSGRIIFHRFEHREI